MGQLLFEADGVFLREAEFAAREDIGETFARCRAGAADEAFLLRPQTKHRGDVTVEAPSVLHVTGMVVRPRVENGVVDRAAPLKEHSTIADAGNIQEWTKGAGR